MKKKIIIPFIILGAVLILSTVSICTYLRTRNTISSLAYDSNLLSRAFNKDGSSSIVYVLEDGQYVPFLVLTNHYNGKTLLLRKDVLPETRRMNDYSCLYKTSEMDTFLNTEYLSMLSSIESQIVLSQIKVTTYDSIGVAGSETEIIDRKVFLLSLAELNQDNIGICGMEGVPLKYFKNYKNRVAYRNGKPASWWLRTPNAGTVSCQMFISRINQIDFTNAYDENCVRPAFCVSPSAKIESNGEIIPNEVVYILSEE